MTCRLPVALALLALVVLAPAADAQTPGPAEVAPPGGFAIVGGYEYAWDSYSYEFANPSTISTPFPVPHTYRQTYTADNNWLVASARYEFLGQWFESEFGITPEITTFGSDIDTFYNPDNDVVTSGTSGDVLLKSLRFTQWSEGKIGRMALRFGYRFRQDHADYLPADIVVTHSNPPSESRTPTTDPEETISRVQELMVDFARGVTVTGKWRVVLGGTVSPLLLARLTTRLPVKYPGVDIVEDAQGGAVYGRAQLVREGSALRPMVGVTWGTTWSYDSERQFSRDLLQASFKVIWKP